LPEVKLLTSVPKTNITFHAFPCVLILTYSALQRILISIYTATQDNVSMRVTFLYTYLRLGTKPVISLGPTSTTRHSLRGYMPARVQSQGSTCGICGGTEGKICVLTLQFSCLIIIPRGWYVLRVFDAEIPWDSVSTLLQPILESTAHFPGTAAVMSYYALRGWADLTERRSLTNTYLLLLLLLSFALGPLSCFTLELIWNYGSHRQLVRLLERGISPVARPLPTQDSRNTQKKYADRHPCLKWDSNSWSQCLRRRRHLIPQTARPLWSTVTASRWNSKGYCYGFHHYCIWSIKYVYWEQHLCGLKCLPINGNFVKNT
jgi:hypothetical protein